MRRRWVTLALVLFLYAGLAGCKSNSPEDATRDAVAAATSWLALLDAGKYDDAWQNSDDAIKGAGAKEQFAKMMGQTRDPLGKEQSRTVQDKGYAKDPNNAPPGEYVQIHFKSSFEKVQEAVELVTLKKESDGSWKVGQYSVEPQ